MEYMSRLALYIFTRITTIRPTGTDSASFVVGTILKFTALQIDPQDYGLRLKRKFPVGLVGKLFLTGTAINMRF